MLNVMPSSRASSLPQLFCSARSLDIDPTEPPKALHPGASRINGCFKPQKQLPIAPYALISEQSAKVSAL
jgi:hypothetical protein